MDPVQEVEEPAGDEHAGEAQAHIVRDGAKEGVGQIPLYPVEIGQKEDKDQFEEIGNHRADGQGDEVELRGALPQGPDDDGMEGGEGHGPGRMTHG